MISPKIFEAYHSLLMHPPPVKIGTNEWQLLAADEVVDEENPLSDLEDKEPVSTQVPCLAAFVELWPHDKRRGLTQVDFIL
jgi:hypothetical protein